MGVDTPLAALSRVPAPPRLLQAALRPGHQPRHRPAARDARDELRTAARRAGNLLDESPDHARRLAGAAGADERRPRKLRALPRDRFRTVTLDCTFDARGGGRALERALDALCRRASRAIALGEEILVLSDRSAGPPDAAPIPALLATAAVHSHLVREGWRTRCGLVVESGEPREVMDFALLVGFGAAAVNPYVALDLVAAQRAAGEVGVGDRRGRAGALRAGRRQGPAQGALQDGRLDRDVVPRRAAVRVRRALGRRGRALLHRHAVARRRHRPRADRGRRAAPPRAGLAGGELDPGGVYGYRLRGERHIWNPKVISALQRAVRDERPRATRRSRPPPTRRTGSAARCAACSNSCRRGEPRVAR